MDAKQLNEALYDKMAAEQKQFRQELLSKTPEDILCHAYEYAMREDILMKMKGLDISAPDAAELLASLSPLADIYKTFCDMDTDHMDVLQTCIERQAETLLEARLKAIRSIPLYRESVQYAKEHGEIDLWRASHKANISCRNAIEAAIQDGHAEPSLSMDFTEGVLVEFGPERVVHVLAATLQDKAWDQRFSKSNQVWAAEAPMFDTEGHHVDYAIKSHPVLLDNFVSQIRENMDIVQEQPAKKPSIKAQLATAKAAQAQKIDPQQRQKDRGER